MLALKKKKETRGNGEHDTYDDPEIIGISHNRQIDGVHAEKIRHERQRKRDEGHDGERFHNFILFG